MGWHLLCLLLLHCIGSIYTQSVSYNANCPSDFKQYEDNSCFRLFVGSYSFQSGSDYCNNTYNSKLLTISSTLQYNRTSTYIKLHGNSELYWIGLFYRNNSEGDLVLTDIDGNVVNDVSFFGLDKDPAMESCIYMTYNSTDKGLRFVPDDCSISHNIVCLTEWPAPPAVNISSTPSGYGVSGQQVNLTCEVSSVAYSQPTVQWRVNGSLLRNDTLTNGVVIHQILNFQLSNEGDYSCVVTTKYWSVSSDTVNVKIAALPNITRQPMDAALNMGQQGFFECLPDKNNFPEPSVMWYKDGTPINTSTNSSSYFVSPNTKTLLLSKVTANDIGDYYCTLFNPAGSVRSEQAHLDVKSLMGLNGSGDDGSNPSDNDTFVEELLLMPQPLTVFVGDNATFDCVGPEGSTSYQWIAYNIDGKVVHSNSTRVPEDDLFSSWAYRNVKLNNVHMVQCVVTVVNGSTIPSENVTLKVVERADVTNMSGDATVQYGSDHELTCSFAGAPSPKIKWMFNGEPIAEDDYKTDDQMSILTIKDFQPSNVGVYQCHVSNQYSSGIGSTTLYGKDGQPGYVIGSVFSITKHQVSVSWFFIGNPNSDPDLIQFQISWKNKNDGTFVPRSILAPPSIKQYNITDLNPSFYLSVTIVVVTPSMIGSVFKLPYTYPFGNAPNYPPDHISVLRVDNNTAINISWDPIIPDHSKGEGDIFDYEIQYRNKKIPLAMATEQVSGTWVYIDGLYFKGVYEVRIRCIVMIQSIPLSTVYERGPWSKWVESTGESSTAAPITGSSDDNSAQVVVPIVISVVLLLVVGGAGIYVLWRWRVTRHKASDRGNITYSSMKNDYGNITHSTMKNDHSNITYSSMKMKC